MCDEEILDFEEFKKKKEEEERYSDLLDLIEKNKEKQKLITKIRQQENDRLKRKYNLRKKK